MTLCIIGYSYGVTHSPLLVWSTHLRHGAIGNYLSSLPFGFLLDKAGPKICGVVASLLFGLGVFLCSFAKQSTVYLDIGFTLLGFVSDTFLYSDCLLPPLRSPFSLICCTFRSVLRSSCLLSTLPAFFQAKIARVAEVGPP